MSAAAFRVPAHLLGPFDTWEAMCAAEAELSTLRRGTRRYDAATGISGGLEVRQPSASPAAVTSAAAARVGQPSVASVADNPPPKALTAQEQAADQMLKLYARAHGPDQPTAAAPARAAFFEPPARARPVAATAQQVEAMHEVRRLQVAARFSTTFKALGLDPARLRAPNAVPSRARAAPVLAPVQPERQAQADQARAYADQVVRLYMDSGLAAQAHDDDDASAAIKAGNVPAYRSDASPAQKAAAANAVALFKQTHQPNERSQA